MEDKRSGTGRLIDVSGNVYIGEFKDNRRHGQGTFFDVEENSMFVGTFDKGYKEGFGKLTFVDGSYFEGNYYCGLRSGQGLDFRSVSHYYQGNYNSNLPHGYGRLLLTGRSSS